MNELTLTYPNLLEQILISSEEKIQEIKTTIKHYERLKMPTSLIQKAKNGAVAVLLKSMGFQMLRATCQQQHYPTKINWEIFKVREDGEDNLDQLLWDNQNKNSFKWALTKLVNYNSPIPLEILEKLPNNATEKAYIFHPSRIAPDPILAYPLMIESICYTTKTILAPKWYDSKNTEFIREDKILPGPYFAGIFKWE